MNVTLLQGLASSSLAISEQLQPMWNGGLASFLAAGLHLSLPANTSVAVELSQRHLPQVHARKVLLQGGYLAAAILGLFWALLLLCIVRR